MRASSPNRTTRGALHGYCASALSTGLALSPRSAYSPITKVNKFCLRFLCWVQPPPDDRKHWMEANSVRDRETVNLLQEGMLARMAMEKQAGTGLQKGQPLGTCCGRRQDGRVGNFPCQPCPSRHRNAWETQDSHQAPSRQGRC
jgi:hypothetical protein